MVIAKKINLSHGLVNRASLCAGVLVLVAVSGIFAPKTNAVTVPTMSLTASPYAVKTWHSTTISFSWNNATHCSSTGTLPGWNNAVNWSGSSTTYYSSNWVSPVLGTVNQDYVVQLYCWNGSVYNNKIIHIDTY